MEDKYDTWCLRAWRRRRTVTGRPAAARHPGPLSPYPSYVLERMQALQARVDVQFCLLSAYRFCWNLQELAPPCTGTPPAGPGLSRVCHHALHMTNGYYQRSCSTRQYRFIINIESQSFSSLFRFGRFGARRRGSGPGSAKIKLKRRCFIFPCSTLLLRRR